MPMFAALAVVLFPLGSVSAFANPLDFTLTGSSDASFILDSNPVPANYDDGSTSFSTELTASMSTSTQTVTFYTSSVEGGLYIPGSDFVGMQIFSGTTESPVFAPGDFDLFTPGSDVATEFLTISAMSSVPLPASAPLFGVALMVIGAVGYGLNCRKVAVAG